MRIKTLLKDNSLYISIAITILITLLSLIKTHPKPIVDISNLDKVQHTFAYMVLTISWLVSRDVKFNTIPYSVILIACLLFGIIIEVLQGRLTTYRSASLLDVVANSLGIAIGFMIFKTFKGKKADI
ncbi:VanZ family protein [Flavobacteriaceae bacterium S356]|uniref:VanZ family protein n=1 Tax=Asprobacillus argus TaxID=3076534 RepID=A0ABU3LG40_9FLAO|nr:VanZ family protein [Flavobacteriaceae bacterium S356]